MKRGPGADNDKKKGASTKVNATIVEVEKQAGTTAEKPTSVPEDVFSELLNKKQIIEPPFNMFELSMLNEKNTELNQCIEAYETNIEAFGHRFVPRIKQSTDGSMGKIGEQAKNEKINLENFFAYCTKESFINFRRKLRRDLEQTGNAYYEVVRNARGQIQSFIHIPSYQMRITPLEDEPVLMNRKILELQKDGSVKVIRRKEWSRFRKFVQGSLLTGNINHGVTTTGHKTRWFKEFGDNRVYNNQTGELVKPGDKIKRSDMANEVIHIKLYTPRSPYGLPRYIGNLLSIYGDRASEQINYITFKNNNIPSLALLVSNGQITQGTIDRIESFVESQIQGSDNYSKFLIIEAEGGEEGEDGGQVKVDIKPLTKEQHKDALFQKYSENNQDKVRRAFRLPPILVGSSEGYNRATADSSIKLADEQIFAPERDEFDSLMNRSIFPDMGVIYHTYRSNSPDTTDNTELVKILAGSEKTGGMTPRVAREILEDVLNKELPPFPEGFDADVPFSLTMAEAVKNMADPAEPGQQVTALKQLTQQDPDDVFAIYLSKIAKDLEETWREQAFEDTEHHHDHEH